MKIRRIETFRVRIPLKPAYRMVSSLGRHEQSDYVLVRPVYHQISVVRRPLEIRGPLTTVPAEPGLGVQVDWNRIRSLAP